eukprot:CAMPEP_0177161256 /NCGR_PEP_ID=MMETSP0367-20130122/5265_1 /TAXON_ID=447022 ORGANISM="Scrippsiella hangoei-like, Strain SHHI-4" /NCGR_SAMPLE_ID=MMETSP0367 /ASSEMBLY_ACC=CAM_ASM_000362 /LENGTH=584 /DNA_ID=CAMNT_0018606969 /DNA_START=11 /DNA_END=1765 /DNA_ORIENTATION=-
MKPPRWLVLATFCLGVQVFMSYDGGATPASIDTILNDSGIEWTQVDLGLLGSLDKFGMTISCVLWGRVLQQVPAKALLVVGLFLNALSTFAFGTVRLKAVMFIAKFLMGVTQGLQCVWSTCWVLIHAPADSRTVWMSLGTISAGIGNGIGTAVAGFGTSEGLPYAFAWQVESGVLAFLWFLLVLCPSDSLSIDTTEADTEITEPHPPAPEHAVSFESVKTIPEDGDSRVGSPCNATGSADFHPFPLRIRSRGNSAWDEALEEIVFHGRQASQGSTTRGEVREDGCSSKNNRRENVKHTADYFDEFQLRRARAASHCVAGAPVVVETDAFAQIGRLAGQRLYIWTALGLAAVMFVTSGVQFLWVRVFMAAWGIGKGFAVTGFLISTGLGGTVGVVLGPQVIDRCGGFMTTGGRSKSLRFIRSMMSLSVLGAVACIVALTAKWQKGMLDNSPHDAANRYLLYGVWLAIFVVFAGFNASIAGLTGINIASVDSHMRSIGSGCTVSIQNLLGYAMGPLLPGFVMDLLSATLPWSATDPAWPVELLCCGLASVLLGAVLALGCSICALRAARRESKQMIPGVDNKPLLE